MKKEYKDLELETVRFDAEDVITASGDPCKPDCIAVECIFGICECKGPMCECVRY